MGVDLGGLGYGAVMGGRDGLGEKWACQWAI